MSRLLKMVSIAVFVILYAYQHVMAGLVPWIPSHLIGGIVGFLLVASVAEFIRDSLTFFYKRRKGLLHASSDNITIALQNLYYLVLGGAFFYFVLYVFKLRPREFFTGISVISAAIAILLKDYISNILSGVVLSFSDKIKISDYVQIGKHKGEVMDFTLSSITLRNDDDELVHIPTNIAYSNELINYTSLDGDKHTITFEHSNKMKIPLQKMEELIHQQLNVFDQYIQPGSMQLYVETTNAESTTFKYHYILNVHDIQLVRNIKATVLKTVYDHTRIAGAV